MRFEWCLVSFDSLSPYSRVNLVRAAREHKHQYLECVWRHNPENKLAEAMCVFLAKPIESIQIRCLCACKRWIAPALTGPPRALSGRAAPAAS